MRWIVLVISGLFEVFMFVFLQLSAGFTEWIPSLLAIGAAVVSYMTFQFSRKRLSSVVAYGIHLGIALVGLVFCSFLLLDEPVDWIGLLFLWLVFLGVVGFYGEHEEIEEKEG